MGENPSKFQEGWSAGLRPVENINMDDITLFLDRLNQRDAVMYLGLVGRWRYPPRLNGSMFRAVAKDVGPLATKMWNWMNTGGMQEFGGTTWEVGLKANPWGLT